MSREIPTRYLTRVWPETEQPPDPGPSEMWCPESNTEGEAANDRAMIHAIRSWAQQRADAEARPYSYEVRRYTTVGSLNPSIQTKRVITPLTSGTAHPTRPPASASPPAHADTPGNHAHD